MASITANSTGARNRMGDPTRDSSLLPSVLLSHNLDSSPTDFIFEHTRCSSSTRRLETAQTEQTVKNPSLINPAGHITVTTRRVSECTHSSLSQPLSLFHPNGQHTPRLPVHACTVYVAILQRISYHCVIKLDPRV